MHDMNLGDVAIGSAYAGGFYAGRIAVDGAQYVLIVASKEAGERTSSWNNSNKNVPGAHSYSDGLANTNAMGEAGSDLAKWARALRIAGCDDWYIPSQDELEVIYRNLKPTKESNTLYGRSGINLSAVPPTHSYTKTEPGQTVAPLFAEGGAEAFKDSWYWSSTQHAAYADCAWHQNFRDGYQGDCNKSFEGRARAVRRLIIS